MLGQFLISQTLRVDANLEVGATSETVTGDASLLQTETPEVGTTINKQQLDQLPLSFGGGRSPENFAYKLTPGVEGGTWQAKINGSPFFSKEVLLDGATVTTYLSGHFGESYVSPEALGEFKIQTSGLSSEYGRTGGGVFNFVMRSGENQVHGSCATKRSTPIHLSITRADCRGCEPAVACCQPNFKCCGCEPAVACCQPNLGARLEMLRV